LGNQYHHERVDCSEEYVKKWQKTLLGENFFQIAKGHTQNKRGSDGTNRASPKKKSVDKAKGD
jgi:hypothetical protein